MRRENGRQPTAGARRPVARGSGKRARRNRRKPEWLRVILSVLLLLLGAECIWAAFHSPRLAVRQITVIGSKTLSPDQVAAMTGIRVGDNIFRANLHRARLRVRAVPSIREANIARLLPGTIAVTLVERQPRLILVQGARRYEVDGEGVVFREAPPGRGGRRGELPLLALRPGQRVRPGETLPRPLVEAALHCVRLARAEGLLLWKMSIDAHDDLWLNVHVAGPGEATLSLPIRVGRPQELSAKIADTRYVLQHAPQLAAVAQYLDVSCPRRPAYRMAAGEPGRAAAPIP